MFIRTLETTDRKPDAFTDRDDIEYVHIVMDGLDFPSWGTQKMELSFQIPKGMRDLSELLDYIFSRMFPLNTLANFSIAIEDELLRKTGWEFNGGTWRVNDTDTYQEWRKLAYRKSRKDGHEVS